jgi:class 3 adenylate cyclase
MHRRIKIVVDRFLPARQMLILVFTDIVGSTERLASEGDARWRELLDTYRATVRRELKKYRGHEVGTAGDSFFATFESPLHALACAQAIATATTKIGLGTRIGLHRGEVEMRGESVSGLAVHTAARIMGLATAEEILVSSTVLETVRGADLVFEDRGPHALKGVPGVWRVYAVS